MRMTLRKYFIILDDYFELKNIKKTTDFNIDDSMPSVGGG